MLALLEDVDAPAAVKTVLASLAAGGVSLRAISQVKNSNCK